MGLWDRFESIANTEEVAEAKASFAPIDPGKYQAVLEKLEAGENKDGLPIIKSRFRTTTNKAIPYNINIQNLSSPDMTKYNIVTALDFIGAIVGEDLEYEGMTKLQTIIESVTLGQMYDIEVSYGKKDTDMKYPKVKVSGTAAETPFD